MDIEHLGARVSEHPTDNRRRGILAIAFLVGGIAGVGIGLALIISVESRPRSPGQTRSGLELPLGGMVGLGGLAAILGACLLVGVLRRRGESYVLHENGLVYRVADGVRVIPWSDIAAAQVTRAPADGVRPAPLDTLFGNEFSFRVQLVDGRRLRINSYTRDAPRLAEAIAGNVATDPA